LARGTLRSRKLSRDTLYREIFEIFTKVFKIPSKLKNSKNFAAHLKISGGTLVCRVTQVEKHWGRQTAKKSLHLCVYYAEILKANIGFKHLKTNVQ
jgi:hypothetical protein